MSDHVARKNLYKNSGKQDEMRRRRTEGSFELRKQRKEEQLMKRRNIQLDGEVESDEQSACETNAATDTKSKTIPLMECYEALTSGVRDSYVCALESVRRHLSRQKSPPLDQVIELGLVPILVRSLYDKNPHVQFEAAWSLTNITSGSSLQTATVVNAGVVPPLVALMVSGDPDVAEQCTWAMSNVIGDSASLRDVAIEAGCINPLIYLANNTEKENFLRTVTWAFSNLCRHKTNPLSIHVLPEILPTIVKLLHHQDQAIVIDACWALSYISDGPDERIDMVIGANVLGRLCELASGGDSQMASPAVRCLGNIVTGNDTQTQAVINAGVLTTVAPHVFQFNKQSLNKECCWLISNICAGTTTQIQSVIEAGLLQTIIGLLEKADYRTQQEAAWVISNICSGGSLEQIAFTLQQGSLTAICNLLKISDSRTLLMVLETLQRMLQAADKINHLDAATRLLEECGGLDLVETLQTHENEDVYKAALSLIERYFMDEEKYSDNDSHVATDNPTATSGGYQF